MNFNNDDHYIISRNLMQNKKMYNTRIKVCVHVCTYFLLLNCIHTQRILFSYLLYVFFLCERLFWFNLKLKVLLALLLLLMFYSFFCLFYFVLLVSFRTFFYFCSSSRLFCYCLRILSTHYTCNQKTATMLVGWFVSQSVRGV